jgi:hypothetical protein
MHAHVAGVGLSHLTGDVKRLMGLVTKYDQDNYPEMLGHICIINAPGVFRMLWNVVKGMIDPRTQSKIEVRQVTEVALWMCIAAPTVCVYVAYELL